MVDTTYPVYSIFAFVGFVVSLVPLPWHLQAWNSGTCYYMMWSALSCLNQFVNSVVWAGNTINHSPAWCEISIRVMMAASVGLPASSLCINRRLYHIANVQTGRFGHANKSRAILIDSLICVVFPLVFVAMQFIVQGHRFDIFEDIGCYPALFNTPLTYFMACMWPIVIGVISATYCTLSLRAFTRRRLEFSQYMNSSNPSLTLGRYFRLMALAMSDILLTTPLAIFTIYLNLTVSPVHPWQSWEDTHYDYSRIKFIPAFLWRSSQTLAISMEFTRWVSPLCAFVFFAFFGFADEARKNYVKFFSFIVRPFRRILPPATKEKKVSSTGHSSLPKTPTTAKSSYATSSILPSYSPPSLSSFYPVGAILDIKPVQPTDSTKLYEDLRSPFTEKRDTADLEQALDTPTLCHTAAGPDGSSKSSPFRSRFSWKDISVPFSDRRHSSYF